MLMKKTKYAIFSLIILLAVASVVFFASVNTPVNAGDETIKTVQEYLDKNNSIDYSYVDLKDGVLTVSLNSKGIEYCTLEDVQALQYIYDAVCALESENEVNNVRICVIGATGDQIYDFGLADVSAIVEGKDQLTNENYIGNNSARSNNIISTLESIFTEHCKAEISEIAVEPSTILSGNCLTVVLTENNIEDVTASTMERLHEELEAYSFTTGKIKQCDVTVQDTTGETIIYMGASYDYGNCSIWFHPDYLDILADNGPPAITDDSVPTESAEQSSFVETTESTYE